MSKIIFVTDLPLSKPELKAFDRLIESIDLSRDDVLIANLNLDVSKQNVKYVVALGLTAAEKLIDNPKISVTNMIGNLFKRNDYSIFVTFHPKFMVIKPSNEKHLFASFKKFAKIAKLDTEKTKDMML